MARSALRQSTMAMLFLSACTAAVWPSAATAAAEAPKAEDPRLNRSITLDLKRVPLSDLCEVLERRSGVAHRVADPATGDLLADVVGTLTVAQLHQALAAVLGVGWKRSGKEAAAGYVVKRFPAKQMEEAREQAEADRAFGDGLRRMLAAANLPEGAENQEPLLSRILLQHPGQREAVRILGDLAPAERDKVFSGPGIDQPVATLSPQGQARVKQIVEEFERTQNRAADEELADPPKPGSPRLRRREHPLILEDGQAWRIQIGPKLGLGGTAEAMYFVHVYSPTEPGIATGFSVPTAPPGHQNPARYRLSISGSSRKEAPSEATLPDQVRTQGRGWEEIARDLARTLGRPVVSDAYRQAEYVFLSVGPTMKDENLESYLDRACRSSFHRRWGRIGSVLLFQRCDWATLRRAQIPESLAQRWKQHVIDTGQVSFEHLVEMAALTPYQLPILGSVMGRQADLVGEHRELLRLWKALPEARRGSLRGEGLVIRDLPLAAQPQARAVVSAALNTSAPLALASAKLHVEQTEESFTFSVLSPQRPAVVRRIELTSPPWFRDLLRNDESGRVAALRAAEKAVQGSLPPDARIKGQ
jgi:hypothetical protein